MSEFANVIPPSFFEVLFFAIAASLAVSIPVYFFRHTFNGESASPYVLRDRIDVLKTKLIKMRGKQA